MLRTGRSDLWETEEKMTNSKTKTYFRDFRTVPDENT
jgi:hypothetical protein